jgi:hypothetical protein
MPGRALIKKNKATEEQFPARRGGTRWQPKPSPPPPPPPVATFGPRPSDLEKTRRNAADLGQTCRWPVLKRPWRIISPTALGPIGPRVLKGIQFKA